MNKTVNLETFFARTHFLSQLHCSLHSSHLTLKPTFRSF